MKIQSRVKNWLTIMLVSAVLVAGNISVPLHPVKVHAEGVRATSADEYSYMAAPGVKHTSITLDEPESRQAIQVMEVDPKSPHIQIQAVSSRMEVSRGETVGYMIREQETMGRRVVGGVNGDFFSSVGVPSGLQISNGELISSPGSIKALMYILADGSVHLEENVTMTAVVQTGSGSALDIDMVNRTRVPSHNDRAFLFTSRFGSSTRTPVGGVEVVLGVEEARLVAGQPVKAVVQSIEDGANTLIGAGQYVLSATGTKADWVRNALAVGDELEISVSFDKGINEAREVISGNSTLGRILLKDGEIPAQITDPGEAVNRDRHPRTMLGVTADGKLIIAVVDGRMPGYADGMTFEEQARYLQSLGAVNAINIDGGGSSTYYVRQPGDLAASLLNVPSDGSERPVGNALIVVSTAETEQLEGLVLSPNRYVQVAPGSQISFEVKGIDRNYNPVTVQANDLKWVVNDGIGKVDDNGVFTAGTKERTGQVKVHAKGGIQQTVDVAVTNEIARIALSHDAFVAEPGSVQALSLKAYDAIGREIQLSANQASWTADGVIGSIRPDGVFTAGSNDAQGTITAVYGDHSVTAEVHVGPSPVIESFEDLDSITASEVRTVPGSVALSLVTEPGMVKFGQSSGKLTYDLTGTSGTSAAYVNLLNAAGQPGRVIEGKPKRIGLWVYGDGNMHQLRLGVTDGSGANKLWNFTSIGGTNWTGEWRYVSLEVPQDTLFPIVVRNIAMEEKNVNNKQAGVLYYDQLTAEYGEE